AAGAKAVAVTPSVVAQAQKTLADEAQPAISWEFVSKQEAERRAGRPVMTIPGLEVVNVGVAVSGSGFLVRTTQRLADQNLIELLQEAVTVVDPTAEMRREAVAAAAAPAPAQPGFRTDATGAVILTMKRGNLMLTGRAALPVDSLRALMQRATN
ncbi:MAG TPA: hypothetical protein VK864_15460, partial [Longimicrobiales bacterium]|nr:hypothetical protein [Longimicrobiales bacterium]